MSSTFNVKIFAEKSRNFSNLEKLESIEEYFSIFEMNMFSSFQRYLQSNGRGEYVGGSRPSRYLLSDSSQLKRLPEKWPVLHLGVYLYPANQITYLSTADESS